MVELSTDSLSSSPCTVQKWEWNFFGIWVELCHTGCASRNSLSCQTSNASATAYLFFVLFLINNVANEHFYPRKNLQHPEHDVIEVHGLYWSATPRPWRPPGSCWYWVAIEQFNIWHLLVFASETNLVKNKLEENDKINECLAFFFELPSIPVSVLYVQSVLTALQTLNAPSYFCYTEWVSAIL